MDEAERQKKLEAGRAKLASFRKKRAKSNGAGATKKTQKGKGQTVPKNDCSTQDRWVEAPPPSAGATALESRTSCEQCDQQEESFSSPDRSLSPVEDLREEELATLTGKEQLKVLQTAVEKRNEIIAKLSHNLQDALASRDQVQLEAQSLAGQIQALQKQLQQTSVEFLRIKGHSGAEAFGVAEHHHDLSSKTTNIRPTEGISEGSENAGHGSQQSPEGFSTETVVDTAIHNLMLELEEERKNNQRICEKQGREEEQKELQNLQTQLSQAQNQCLVMQQYKEEKEKLNIEILELRKKLQEAEDSERRSDFKNESPAFCSQTLEEVNKRLEDEMKMLREEVDHVRQLLDKSERELKRREEEVEGLKASKNRENQTKAAFIAEANLEAGPDERDLDTSLQGDILMDRYLSSIPPAHSQSSLDLSADCSFELNSEVFGDQPLLSISNRICEQNDNIQNISGSQHSAPELSEQQQLEEIDLEKQLLSQQCGELREELALKERDLGVLREEVRKSAEELEEARSRWALVTEELQEALGELEEERERRRLVEEEMNLKAHKQDNCDDKDVLMEEWGNETGQTSETPLIQFTANLSEYADESVGEINEEKQVEVSLLLPQSQEELQMETKPADSTKDLSDPTDTQIQTSLETTKEQKATLTLLSQETPKLNAVSEELEMTRTQFLELQAKANNLQQELLKSQDRLDSAEREKRELEGQIHTLRENLACLEEAQAQSVKQREEEKKKEQQMDEQIKKMEQVLEKELEQFENIIKSKEAEEKEKLIDSKRLLVEKVKEKEEEVKVLLEKQILAVEEATARLKASHEQEVRNLIEKHQQEVRYTNRINTELLKQRVSMEEEHKRQISFIKEVTEREHERMMSELTAKHNQELEQLRTEVSLELRESFEAAHQAEMQEVQTLELEALRVSLTTVYTSQLEASQASEQQAEVISKLKASMKETFTQERAILQAQHESDLEKLKQENQEQQDRLQKQHQLEMDELKQQWETRFDQERASMEEKRDKEIEVTSLSEIQNRLNAAQTELINTQASLTETSRALVDARAALSETQSELHETKAALEEQQTSSKEQVQKLEEDLKQAWADKEAAAGSLQELVSRQETALQEKEQQVRHLEEKERQLQLEVSHLQEEKVLLKKSSEEEVGQLWTQLENMRASRQELGELKEQLMARTSQVDDIERLKTEFSEQKQEIKELHETELENLRKYFEKRLHASEETYKEEIALLQLRLVESALEESVMKTEDALCASLRLELEEKHAKDLSQLESSLALSYKDELQQERSNLTDQYYEELQEMKTRHALELEQLRAKLSESHVQENKITRYAFHFISIIGFISVFFLNNQVEIEQRLWHLTEELQTRTAIIHNLENNLAALSEQHKSGLSENNLLKLREELQRKHENEISALRSDFEREKKCLEKALDEEREKRKSLEVALDDDDKSQQHLKTQYDNELQNAKDCMAVEINELRNQLLEQSEEKLRLAQYEKSMAELNDKHKAELEHERTALLNKHLEEMNALNAKHKAQLDSLSACHTDQLAATLIELEKKHKAELVALESALQSKLEAAFQETSQAQLEALEAELVSRHQEERDELEKRMLGNMDTLEATYLKEVQLEEKHRQDLISKASEHKQLMECQAAEQLSIREELKRELAQVQMEKFKAMAAELTHVHKVIKYSLITENFIACKLWFCNWVELQELRGTSERELEACRRELEEEAARQKQHFLKELELLKVQSEERLQDRINHLKTEFEERKEAELEGLRRSLTSQQQEKEQSYTSKMSQLTTQLQQLDAVVTQLRAEIGCLQEELHGKRSEMETLDTLLQRRERESQEGSNLLKMLTDDLQDAKEESLLVTDSQISPGGEESALKACSRLRLAVETLLDLLNQAHTQLEQTCSVHFTLEEKFSQGREDATQLLEQHKLLLKQLDDEARLKSRLQLELHKAEGLLEGYVAEKAALEESLQQKEAQEERLAEELEGLKVKLHKMQGISEHAILLRQKEHLSAGLGEREKALLAETERLTQDRLDLQRQAEKDHKSLSLRLRNLERELEDQETKGLEKDLQHKTHVEDLGQRVQALEKQLKYDRQFIEEQAVEREHERDEFQQEIRRLEAELRQTGNVDNKAHKVESLQALIRDKTEDHASLLEANQQAQRDLAERNEEIDKLAGRIRELEQALLNSAESVRAVNEMEQELRKAKLREQELTQDKLALEQQQLSSRLQISALQSKLDEKRHCYHDNTHDPTDELRDALDAAQENLHRKEQEVEVLLNQLENVQRHLNQKEVELKHLTAQLEVLTNNNAAQVEELQKEISTLKETISSLTEVNENKEQTWSAVNEEEPLPAALLQEKNQEIDHLNCEIQKLEQELESERDSKVLEVELEDLRSQVEHLRSEITRVRQEKQEEEERLHEVISTLQAELATLAPNLHEVSDSQDGDSINPSPSPSPEPHTDNLQDRRGGPNSLKHEISLTHSTSSSSLHSRLKAVQSQFETAVAEKEGLERLLLTQEEEYRAQVEEFGKRLGAERGKLDDTQSLLRLRETEFEEEKEKRKLSEEERDKMELLREASLTFEKQVQEVRAENLEMEKVVSEARERIKTLETMKGELSAEREALRRRECQLQEEIEKLRKEVGSMRDLIQELTAKLREKETGQEEAQTEVLTHADVTLAKADAALRQKESEFAELKSENEALKSELAAVKQGLNTISESAAEPHENGQLKVDLEAENQRMKAELERLQHDTRLNKTLKPFFFFFVLIVSRDEASLSSPEVLRRLECSEERIRERFHASVLDSHLSELSGLNCTNLEPSQVKTSPRVMMEPQHSRTITPDPTSRSSHSPGSLSVSDHFSGLDSMDPDKDLDLTAPPSPLGSTSSFSAQEWNSDGYGSNVSSELGARLRVELEQTERLDAQFVQYLRCRGINPTANTDSAAGSMSYSDDLLSPELQGLLKKVYQESCRILTLSQRRSAPSSQPNSLDDNPASSHPPMSWQQEKRALQETVVALRELLCRMAQRQTQEAEEAMRAEQARFLELQQELDQERALILRKNKEEEQRREVRKAVQVSSEKLKGEVMSLKESRLAESRSKLEEERQHFFRQMDELNRRHESDSARDQKFISDLRSQLEQERRQAEDLATGTDKLRAEVMQSKRKWEEDDRIRLEELQREKEAVARHRAATETLKEQKRELSRTLEMEQQQCRRQEVELAELKERLQLLKEKERERDEHLEKQRRKEREELMEREMRQERTNNKLLELELLRRQDQQRMQELQRTLSDLEREKKEMVSQRLSGKTSSLLQHRAMSPQEDGTASPSSSSLLERVLKENSELTEQVMSLSQEKAVYKSRLTSLEKQLRRTECDLAKVATETENQPISDAGSNSRVRLQRYYERYLRAESFRKALVYQKRYLILLLGGFQDCEQATLALIARMGVRPSPPLIMQRGLLWRFRAVVRVVIAVSRMRFLTRKWQRAIRRVPVSATETAVTPRETLCHLWFHLANPHSDCKEGLGPFKENFFLLCDKFVGTYMYFFFFYSICLSRITPLLSSLFRPHPSTSLASAHSAGTSQDPERSLTEYIHHLEKVQQRLVGARPGEFCHSSAE
uniref:Pericentrin n=1 Tax=Cyprinodon variegatus TaxID=28743 RepID=A0A3Q2FFS1_CYPVA